VYVFLCTASVVIINDDDLDDDDDYSNAGNTSVSACDTG